LRSVRQILRNRASEPVTDSRLQIIFSGTGGGWVAADASAIMNSKTGNTCTSPIGFLNLSLGPHRGNHLGVLQGDMGLTGNHDRML
jgi:hypothetical protein